jgi:hypothetical protein
LIARVRATNLAAYGHQDLPFERLVEVLNPARSLSRHPLFQVMLAFQNNAEPQLELPNLRMSYEPVDTGSAKFDLSLSLREQRLPDGALAGIAGALEYATDLFDRSSIEMLADRFARLLEEAIAATDAPIGQLEIMDAAERHRLLREWNDTARPLPNAMTAELFEAQVAKTPDAVAVVYEEQTLTYGELNARANQLAHHLRARGVGPDIIVGLCLERSLEMIVGLIGILKAGGAYLPLDPGYPRERLASMLEDAAAELPSPTPHCTYAFLITPHRSSGSMPTGPQSRKTQQPIRPATSIRTTSPMSSTLQDQQENQKASASGMKAWIISSPACRNRSHLVRMIGSWRSQQSGLILLRLSCSCLFSGALASSSHRERRSKILLLLSEHSRTPERRSCRRRPHCGRRLRATAPKDSRILRCSSVASLLRASLPAPCEAMGAKS